jgi:hypothetical protein
MDLTDTSRLQDFLARHVEKTRFATRCLILSLDFSALDLTSHQFFEHQLWNATEAKKQASRIATAFPELRCILLDGAPDWLVDTVVADLGKDTRWSTRPTCLMLSAPKIAVAFRPILFQVPHLRSIVYLDISHAPGSLSAILLTSSLPCLRILKVEGREVDNNTALAILSTFKQQLWSLDISHNKLTDAFLEPLVLSSFPEVTLRTAAHHDVEGRLKWAPSAGLPWFGRFGFVDESEYSSSFNHPDRYLADPPTYARDNGVEASEHTNGRHDGRRPIRRDTPTVIKQTLIGRPNQLPATNDNVALHEICASHGGISHLRMNGNRVSLCGIAKLIRESPGHIEHLECDSTLLKIPGWSSTDIVPCGLAAAKLTGFVGVSHLLRPIFCPHLQVLRVHHSLISQIPSIEHESIALGESLWIAETLFGPRVAMAFPQVFEPDMNPRLYSLTLTDVPRYSTGPLISKILRLLKQVSIQERAIQDINAAHSQRASATLKGLRHLHLEFGQDPRESCAEVLGLEGLDATKMLEGEDGKFSFFGQSGRASSFSLSAVDPQRRNDDQGQQGPEDDDNPSHHETPLLAPRNPPPYRSGYAETSDAYESHRGDWNGCGFTVPVWVGSAVPGPHPAVNEYARLLLKSPDLRSRVGPASSGQVLAGVPADSYIYHAAWDAMLAPPIVRKPTATELEGMRDVVSAIKEYRRTTKAAMSAVQRTSGTITVALGEPHYHWSGKLEISFPSVAHAPGMWR